LDQPLNLAMPDPECPGNLGNARSLGAKVRDPRATAAGRRPDRRKVRSHDHSRKTLLVCAGMSEPVGHWRLSGRTLDVIHCPMPSDTAGVLMLGYQEAFAVFWMTLLA